MNWDFSPHILIQGINQPQAIAYLQQSSLQKKAVVAGVYDEYVGESVEEIPVFDLVISAIHKNQIPVVTSLIFNHPYQVLDACYEAIAAGIKQIVIYSDKVPPLDLIKLYQKAQQKQVTILGPAQGGILQPQKYDCGVYNADVFAEGKVGLINFAHESIAQEIALFLQKANAGISTLINLGNSYFANVDWDLWLNTMMIDEQTESIVIVISNISPLEADSLTLALSKIEHKPITIYLLDNQNWLERINHHQSKVILDQIYSHLYPISAIDLIKECHPLENIIVTDNHHDILNQIST